MIAMQYGFTLPADYDMAIIDRRVRDKGPLLDGFPRLRFKAYLSARKQDRAENLYAPFYLWAEPEGIDAFLSGPGFAALTRDFGWPSVQTWLVWHAACGPDLPRARYASRDIVPIAPFTPLAQRRNAAVGGSHRAIAAGALASVAGYEPTAWRSVAVTFWPDPPHAAEGRQLYAVGHVSVGASFA